VRESGNEREFPYSERHVQCVWFDDSLRPKTLRSSDGEEIRVESAGQWNLEAGPDFLDAVLTIGPDRRTVRGDVEVHIRPEDWEKHGHMGDRAYARVVVHVTYFSGSLRADVLPRGAVQISLKDGLKSNPVFSFDNVDVTAYPYAALPAKVTECGNLLLSWQPSDRIALLESAGQERLRAKACRIAETMKEKGRDQTFYEEIMCSLGYKHNRTPFRQIASRVPLQALIREAGEDAMKAYSLFLGVAGLLPAKTSMRWDDETKMLIRQLWDNWWRQRSKWETQCLEPASWHLLGMRPQNHPVRRLAAASVLFTGKEALLTSFDNLNSFAPEDWYRKAEAVLQQGSQMDFWKRRLSFSGKPQDTPAEMIGAGRIAAMLSNVVIPFMAASGVDIEPLLQHLPPEENNNIIRRTAYALFGRDHNPSLYRTGLRQQGLIQIFHDFCLNSKTGCGDCLLPEALKSHSFNL
jgi:hypothetical protein